MRARRLGLLACAAASAALLAPGCAAASPSPFRALWNQPWTEECAGAYAPSPVPGGLVNVSAFGIEANPNFVCLNASLGCKVGLEAGPVFNGPVVATLYPEPTWNDGTGLYPQFTCAGAVFSEATCTAVNGGSPQLGNLTAHLEQWAADIERLFPDPATAAVVSLDWEAWWPLWESNQPDYNGTHYFVYGEVARRLVRERSPGLGKAAVEAQAKLDWEAACKKWLVATIQLAQKLRPRTTWGYYDMPGETGEDGTDRLDYLWNAVDALFPSIYTRYPDTPSNAAFVAKTMTEARRCATNRTDGVTRPIYAYTMPEYEDESFVPPPKVPEQRFLNASDWSAEFELSAKFGLSGWILYGGSADGESSARCDVVRQYMTATFLPGIQRLTEERNACAAKHCSGHGVCIDHDPAAAVACACGRGWAGANCSQQRVTNGAQLGKGGDATLTFLHEHSARLKLDDSGEAPPPPPTISRLSTNRFPMEGVGPPVVLCTKPPLHVPAGEVVTANITQPGVSLRWPTVPEWVSQKSPLRSFPLKAPTPTGSDGCFSVDPGVTAAPGPASLSLAVGKLSTFSTKVVYYESVSVAFGRRPYLGEQTGSLLLMPHRVVMEAAREAGAGVSVSLHLPFATPPRTVTWSSTQEPTLLQEPEQALTFNFFGLPATVNQDVQITFALPGGRNVTKWRRLMRAPPLPRGSFVSPVQVDHSTKSLLIDGRPYSGVGFYLDALDHPHGALHNVSEYIVLGRRAESREPRHGLPTVHLPARDAAPRDGSGRVRGVPPHVRAAEPA